VRGRIISERLFYNNTTIPERSMFAAAHDPEPAHPEPSTVLTGMVSPKGAREHRDGEQQARRQARNELFDERRVAP
jgi:hypothetical protein